jgi:Flp pilus assembly protein CpaB
MTYRARNLVIAIGLALVAMMLTLFYVTNYKRSVQNSTASVQVYVASRDLHSGIAGSELVKSSGLRLEHVKRQDVVPGAISSPDQIQTLVLAGPLYAGEQVTLRRFADAAAQGIRAQLKGPLRAVQMSGDPNQLLAGTLQAGDHVDVVGNLRASGSVQTPTTRIVLRNLTVLTAPTDSTVAKVSSGGSTSAIVAVTDAQVPRLFFVMKNADWTLELRPVNNAADGFDRIATSDSVIKGGSR